MLEIDKVNRAVAAEVATNQCVRAAKMFNHADPVFEAALRDVQAIMSNVRHAVYLRTCPEISREEVAEMLMNFVETLGEKP